MPLFNFVIFFEPTLMSLPARGRKCDVLVQRDEQTISVIDGKGFK